MQRAFTYGMMWNDILNLASMDYTAQTSQGSVDGTYRLQEGRVAENPNYTDAAGTDMPEYYQTRYRLLFTSDDGTFTDKVVAYGTLGEIKKKDVTITWSDNLDIPYTGKPQCPPATINGAFQSDVDAGLVVSGPTAPGTYTNIGQYTLTPAQVSLSGSGSTSYNLTNVPPVTFNIVKATVALHCICVKQGDDTVTNKLPSRKTNLG